MNFDDYPLDAHTCQFRVVHSDFRMGGGLARDSRQIRKGKKLGLTMLKKRVFVKQNH